MAASVKNILDAVSSLVTYRRKGNPHNKKFKGEHGKKIKQRVKRQRKRAEG